YADPSPLFSHGIFDGLKFLLFSINKSIFLFSPILIVAVFSSVLFIREHKKSGVFITVFILALMVLYSKYRIIGGGVCWGPRFTLPAAAFFILYLCPLLKKPSTLMAVLIAAVLLASFAVQIAGVSVNFNQYQALTKQIERVPGAKMPPHIIGHFIMMKHKLTQKNEIYSNADFGIKQKILINQGQTLSFGGLDFWYVHLREIKGIKIIGPVITALLSAAFILFFMIWRYCKHQDKKEYEP
ncbi:MAG: hypothetical protein JW946_03805, partial [Candidatus Omnitrophica bacterium]|nr:hypothetical protein [Candidatus Omnitrophota bacterium]